MQVYILRHAEADFKTKNEDPPVSQEGAAKAERVLNLGNQRLGFKPNVLVSSPLLRAKQTAELVKKQLGLKSSVIVDDCLYGDRKPGDVLKFLSGFKKEDRVVLVSHMPLVFELLYAFVGGRAEVQLLNGSIAAVEFKGKASEGKGKLTWLIQPGV